MEGVQGGAEEGAGLLKGFDAPFDEEFSQHLVDADLRREPFDLRGVGRFFEYPLAFFRHIIQR